MSSTISSAMSNITSSISSIVSSIMSSMSQTVSSTISSTISSNRKQLGGHKSISLPRTGNHCHCIRIWKYADRAVAVSSLWSLDRVLTTFYLNVQLLDCAVSIPDRVLE